MAIAKISQFMFSDTGGIGLRLCGVATLQSLAGGDAAHTERRLDRGPDATFAVASFGAAGAAGMLMPNEVVRAGGNDAERRTKEHGHCAMPTLSVRDM